MTLKHLNRATLARQMLLTRESMTTPKAVARQRGFVHYYGVCEPESVSQRAG
jgi:hypothetical protein